MIVAMIFSYDTKIRNRIKFILYYFVKQHTYYTISMILNLFNYFIIYSINHCTTINLIENFAFLSG